MFKYLVLLFILMSSLLQANAQCRVVFSNGTQIYPVELAHTPEQQQRGLSGREQINEGMLFVWSSAEQRQFWMRNTHIPLRLYYLDDAAIITQQVALTPLSDQRHFSTRHARYAFELTESMANILPLAIGDRLVSVLCNFDE